MRPILRPSARVRLRSPAEVGAASWVEGTSAVVVLEVFLLALPRGATATAVGELVGWVVAFSSGSVASPKAASCESSGLTAWAVVVELSLPFGLLAEGVLAFTVGAIVWPDTLADATFSLESAMTLGGDVFGDACWEGAVLTGCAVTAFFDLAGGSGLAPGAIARGLRRGLGVRYRRGRAVLVDARRHRYIVVK